MATLKKTKIGFQDQLSLNASQKYCRMLPGEHSAILSTFIKLPFVIKMFCLFLSGHFTKVFTVQLNLFKMATLKKTENGFHDQLPLNAGQKYCRMLPGEHSAILSTFIKLPFVIKIFVLSIFKWPFYTGFTVSRSTLKSECNIFTHLLLSL